jgi:hypothetical protein
METAKLYAACAFAAGLVITLFLAAYLTPRQWWRRPNARALCITVLGAWGFGSLILYALHGAQPAAASTPATVAIAAAPTQTPEGATAPLTQPIANQSFQVHRNLNLRRAAGVYAARLVTVPAGATVTPTGVRSGDWWQITASVDGHENTGWVSSLWLRRSRE